MERTTDPAPPSPGPSPAREDRYFTQAEIDADADARFAQYSTQEQIPPDPSPVEDKPFTCISLCNDPLGYRPPVSPAQGDR